MLTWFRILLYVLIWISSSVKEVFYKYYKLYIYLVPGLCNLCLTTVWTAATIATYINGLPQNLSLSLPTWKNRVNKKFT